MIKDQGFNLPSLMEASTFQSVGAPVRGFILDSFLCPFPFGGPIFGATSWFRFGISTLSSEFPDVERYISMHALYTGIFSGLNSNPHYITLHTSI